MEVGEQRVDVCLADFIYTALSRMLGNSYRSRFTPFLFCSCDVFPALISSLCFYWYYSSGCCCFPSPLEFAGSSVFCTYSCFAHTQECMHYAMFFFAYTVVFLTQECMH